MYQLTLVNLSADAGLAVGESELRMSGVAAEKLRGLLHNFCTLDPVENAALDPEIRVQVRNESHLLRTGQRKLIHYDMHRRELAGRILTVEEVMAELDGSAAAARNQAIWQARGQSGPVTAAPELPAAPVPPASSRPRVIALAAAAGLLLAANVYLAAPFGNIDSPADFVPFSGGDLPGRQAALTGVYLTGNEPGQHGIVLNAAGELKLIELAAVDAPRVIYAGYRLGHLGPRVVLVTDQPGGTIELRPDGGLVYCGETYQRIP